MKIVGLLARPDFKSGIQYAQQILEYLEEREVKVLLPAHLAEPLHRKELVCSIDKMRADFVITLGGDGTILYVARHLAPKIPILPVNLESFGFLSECEINEVKSLIDEVLSEKLAVQETQRIAAWVKKARLPDAANEIEIFPKRQGRPVPFVVNLGIDSPFRFRADGFIVATPMGSTGHTLSLAGPVLDLHLDAILLMAVAPLRQGFLPLVVPSGIEMTVQIERDGQIFIDGDYVTDVAKNSAITVKKSDHSLRILRRPSRFYVRLQGKLLRC